MSIAEFLEYLGDECLNIEDFTDGKVYARLDIGVYREVVSIGISPNESSIIFNLSDTELGGDEL